MDKLEMENLGWNDFFAAQHLELGLADLAVARVIAESRGGYQVKNMSGEYLAKVTGKQMFTAQSRADYPAVGDWVVIEEVGPDQAVIRRVLPRKTVMRRRYGDKNRVGEKNETQIIAANIDVALIIEAVDRDYNLNRVERYLAIAKDGGIQPAVILNKVDLISKAELQLKLAEIKNRLPDVAVIATSNLTEEGVEVLKKYLISGQTYCFLGSSGVGKSSLINKLLGINSIKTEEIGARTGRGKHATTSRQMYFLESGAIVIDNPGVREVGMTDTETGIETFFDEITALASDCKYADCTHTHEPDCAVIKAVQASQIDKDQYANYVNLKKEADFFEMSAVEKKVKDRNFGKFLQKAKKDFKNLGLKDY